VNAFLLTVHILACLFLVVVVLLQHGKGADIGAAFGAGASNTVFGGRGAGNFLTKLTTGFVVVFMVTSLSLAYFGASTTGIDFEQEEALIPEPEPESAPFPGAEPVEPDVPSGFEQLEEPDAPSGFETIPDPKADDGN